MLTKRNNLYCNPNAIGQWRKIQSAISLLSEDSTHNLVLDGFIGKLTCYKLLLSLLSLAPNQMKVLNFGGAFNFQIKLARGQDDGLSFFERPQIQNLVDKRPKIFGTNWVKRKNKKREGLMDLKDLLLVHSKSFKIKVQEEGLQAGNIVVKR